MRVLISGGTGFVGQTLVAELKNRGHEVFVLSRNTDKAKVVLGSSFQYLTMESQFPKLDGVINLAGEPVNQRWTKAVKAKIRDSRVLGTARLIDKVKPLNPRFFISASAIGYYGSRGDEILTEESRAGSDFLADVCMQWEDALFSRDDFSARKAVLRTALVFGKDGGILKKLLPIFRLGLGARLGSGNQWMSWIHIDDIVDMYVRLAEDSNLEGPFNASAPEPVTNAYFTSVLARALKRPALFAIPRWSLKLLFGELATALLGSSRVIPQRFLKLDFHHKFQTLDVSALQ